MYDVLESRLIVSSFTSDVPISREDLSNYITSKILEVKDEIRIIKPKKLEASIAYEVYQGEVDDIYSVSRKYYMLSNLPIITIYLTDRKLFKSLVRQLGLRYFKGSKVDLLNIVNIQSGLPWDVDKAKKVCLLSYDDLMKTTGLSYLNSVLLYVTGYQMKDVRETNSLATDVLLNYIGYYLLPYLAKYDKRPTDNIIHHVRDYIREISYALYQERIYEHRYTKDVMRSIGMAGDTLDYFLNSVADYERVDKEKMMKKRPREGGPLRDILSGYSDIALLEAIEEPVEYNYRRDLLNVALDKFSTFTWSLARRKLCKGDIVLSRGRAMDYQCYDPYTLWSNLQEADIEYYHGLFLPNLDIMDPTIRVGPNELENLMEALVFLDPAPKFASVIVNKADYLNIVEEGKCKVLLVDGEMSPIEEEVYRELDHRKCKINGTDIYDISIDYIGIDLMKIGGNYYTIDSYPNEYSLSILRDTNNYAMIIYKHQMEYFEVEVLYNIIDDNGKLLLRKKDKGPKALQEYFKNIGSTKNYNIYRRIKIDPIEHLLGYDWERVDTTGDGNCMYYSIAQSIAQIFGNYTASELRNLMIDSIPPSMFEDFRKDAERALRRKLTDEEVRDRYRSKDEWGTMRELRILAEVLNFTPIVISAARYVSRVDMENLLCSGANEKEVVKKRKLENIILLYQSGGHFENIRRISDGKTIFQEDELSKDFMLLFRKSCERKNSINIGTYK